MNSQAIADNKMSVTLCSQSCRKKIKTACVNLLLFLCAMHYNVVKATDLEGAWRLDAYQTNNEKIRVTGLLVFQDKNFGMIYVMTPTGGGGVSARSHTGEYRLENNHLFFDVQLWVEEVNEEARIVPGQKVSPRIELDGEKLVLHFGSGSTQSLSRLSQSSASDGGDWRLEGINILNGSDAAKASLVTAGGHFVLLYLDKEHAGWAYGGDYDTQTKQFSVVLHQQFKNGEGIIGLKEDRSSISSEYKEALLIIRDSDKNVLEFRQ